MHSGYGQTYFRVLLVSVNINLVAEIVLGVMFSGSGWSLWMRSLLVFHYCDLSGDEEIPAESGSKVFLEPGL